MTTIREFAEHLLEISRNWRRPVDWFPIFEEKGYYHAQCGNQIIKWQEVHQWCESMIGRDHYAYHGEHFWFETEEASVLFILRWA